MEGRTVRADVAEHLGVLDNVGVDGTAEAAIGGERDNSGAFTGSRWEVTKRAKAQLDGATGLLAAVLNGAEAGRSNHFHSFRDLADIPDALDSLLHCAGGRRKRATRRVTTEPQVREKGQSSG
jgi:hypothetical protein